MTICAGMTGLLKTLVIISIAMPLTQLAARDSCQSGQSAITAPLPNYTIPSTYLTEAYSSTRGGGDITAVRLYVDNKAVYTASGLSQRRIRHEYHLQRRIQ